jgi:alpha-amylase
MNTAVTVCFQVHQPYRIRRFSFFEIGQKAGYFYDEAFVCSLTQRAAQSVYLPVTQSLSQLIDRHQGDLKVALFISGTAIEQLRAFAPEVLESFRGLLATECVELLGGTYYHSPASLFHQDEFIDQVKLHREVVGQEFAVTVGALQNAGLEIGGHTADQLLGLGFSALYAGWNDGVVSWRGPLGECRIPSLFIDYHSLAEYSSPDVAIRDRLQALCGKDDDALEPRFVLPSDVAAATAAYEGVGVPPCDIVAPPTVTNSTKANENEMQISSLRELYEFSEAVRARGGDICRDWRRLQAIDHFIDMNVSRARPGALDSAGAFHDGPYKAFIAYRNILVDLAQTLSGA